MIPRIFTSNKQFFTAVSIGLVLGALMMYTIMITWLPRGPEYVEGRSAPELDTNFENINPHHFFSKHEHNDIDRTLADAISEKSKVLCWVMTQPNNHKKKAIHVKATWGKRCNYLVFMSSQEDPNLPSVALPVGEGRDNLWAKTKEAFKYVYKHYIDKADWFLKADDDTFVVVENLRYMLLPYKPSDPIYFGCKFRKFVDQGYMSGGAGYVLSREAVRRFVEEALPDEKKCRQSNSGAEDVELGKCMAAINVLAGDSRDSDKRGRFFPFQPQMHLSAGPKDPKFWYWDYIYYNETRGMGCCSDYAVSFHYVTPDIMYTLEYLVYHLHPFGVKFNDELPEFQIKDEKNTNTISVVNNV